MFSLSSFFMLQRCTSTRVPTSSYSRSAVPGCTQVPYCTVALGFCALTFNIDPFRWTLPSQTVQDSTVHDVVARGRCALNKCYALRGVSGRYGTEGVLRAWLQEGGARKRTNRRKGTATANQNKNLIQRIQIGLVRAFIIKGERRWSFVLLVDGVSGVSPCVRVCVNKAWREY